MRISNIALAVGILAAALAVPMMIEAATGLDVDPTGSAAAIGVCVGTTVYDRHGRFVECQGHYIST